MGLDGSGIELLLISPFGGPPTPLGPAPAAQNDSRVVGVFQSSFYQYDEVFTYTDPRSRPGFPASAGRCDRWHRGAYNSDHYRSRSVGAHSFSEDPRLSRTSHATGKDVFPAFLSGTQDRARHDVPAADDDHGRRRIRDCGDPRS